MILVGGVSQEGKTVTSTFGKSSLYSYHTDYMGRRYIWFCAKYRSGNCPVQAPLPHLHKPSWLKMINIYLLGTTWNAFSGLKCIVKGGGVFPTCDGYSLGRYLYLMWVSHLLGWCIHLWYMPTCNQVTFSGVGIYVSLCIVICPFSLYGYVLGQTLSSQITFMCISSIQYSDWSLCYPQPE